MDPHSSTVVTLGHAIAEALCPLLRTLVVDEVAKQLAKVRPPSALQEVPRETKRTLTYAETRARYGIGRQEWNRLINSGEMPATRRRMRGGHEGWVVSVEEAARVLGGRLAA